MQTGISRKNHRNDAGSGWPRSRTSPKVKEANCNKASCTSPQKAKWRTPKSQAADMGTDKRPDIEKNRPECEPGCPVSRLWTEAASATGRQVAAASQSAGSSIRVSPAVDRALPL